VASVAPQTILDLSFGSTICFRIDMKLDTTGSALGNAEQGGSSLIESALSSQEARHRRYNRQFAPRLVLGEQPPIGRAHRLNSSIQGLAVSVILQNFPIVHSSKRQCCCLDSRNSRVPNAVEWSGDVEGASYVRKTQSSKSVCAVRLADHRAGMV
jgi:hypothetical protein